MSYEITGKLAVKFDTVQRTETFKTREFVIEKSEDVGGKTITNFIKLQSVQDKTAMLDRYNVGDELRVQFNIKGSKWAKDGREGYITNLDAWRIESGKAGTADATAEATNYNDMPPVEGADDLPF